MLFMKVQKNEKKVGVHQLLDTMSHDSDSDSAKETEIKVEQDTSEAEMTRLAMLEMPAKKTVTKRSPS